MKKLFAIALILSLVSCRKFYDHWNDNQNPFAACTIEQLVIEDQQNGAVSYGNFYYNRKGLPDSIIYVWDPIALNRGTNQYFTYDNKGRLITHKQDPITKTYQYVGNNKLPASVIIEDPALERTTLQKFTFDEKGRVSFYIDTVLATTNPDLNVVAYIHPVYNIEGNLISEEISFRQLETGESGSDVASFPRTSAKSPYLTNKIWRLIALDWSINATDDALASNSQGLPTKFANAYFVFGGGNPVTIKYACD